MSASATFFGLIAVCITARKIVGSQGIRHPPRRTELIWYKVCMSLDTALANAHTVCGHLFVPSVVCAPTHREVGSCMTKVVPIDPVPHTVLLPLEVIAPIFWVVHVAMPIAALYWS